MREVPQDTSDSVRYVQPEPWTNGSFCDLLLPLTTSTETQRSRAHVGPKLREAPLC